MKNELLAMIAKDNEYAVSHFARLKTAALTGDAEAQYIVAKVLLSESELSSPNTESAHLMLNHAAMFGNLDAKMLLAHIYSCGYTGFDGKQIPKNRSMAYKIFSDCAQHSSYHGQALAIEKIGDFLLESARDGGGSNQWLSPEHLENSAFLHYHEAALKGLASAQYKQAMMYKEGKGTRKCIVSAHHMLRKSVKQDYAPALNEYETNRDLYV